MAGREGKSILGAGIWCVFLGDGTGCLELKTVQRTALLGTSRSAPTLRWLLGWIGGGGLLIGKTPSPPAPGWRRIIPSESYLGAWCLLGDTSSLPPPVRLSAPH